MASINQNAQPNALPDFRNVGVLMRVLVAVIAMEAIAALIKTSSWPAMRQELVENSALAQPILILSLLMLAVLGEWLRRLPYLLGIVAIITLELGLTVLVFRASRTLLGLDPAALERYLLFVPLITVLLLLYFDLRGRALSPAITEARLQALQARIRPHFLFNSINAVLALMRADPKRAELALEDMAELFRVMLADNRQLVPVAREVELCRQYLELEQLRLGDRLKVEWRIANMPADALIPPLVLQPLLENAIYHGIEPRIEPGTVSIDIYRKDKQVHAVMRNPFQEGAAHHDGNRMAINNIRERLSLHFDAEANLGARVDREFYEVHIVIPYLKAPE